MNSWIIFWTIVIALGIGSFAVLVVAVIPLGGKDVWELLRRLGNGEGVGKGRHSRDVYDFVKRYRQRFWD